MAKTTWIEAGPNRWVTSPPGPFGLQVALVAITGLTWDVSLFVGHSDKSFHSFLQMAGDLDAAKRRAVDWVCNELNLAQCWAWRDLPHERDVT